MLDRLWKIFTSLRLTVICLAFGIVLIWIGTVAQADEGLYQAQSRYFKQWIVLGATLWGHRVPILLPGGYLLGTVLIVNLVSAHIKRFKFTKKQVGINLTHFGIILLLVGQLATDMFSQESHLRLAEGETKNYSENPQRHELVFTHAVDGGREEVVSIPESFVAKGGTITHEKLPFTVRIGSYTINSDVVSRDEAAETAGKLTAAFATVDAEYASPDGLAAQAERAQEAPGRAEVWRDALNAVGEKDTKDLVEAAKRVAAQPERGARLCTELKTRFRAQMAARWKQQGGAMAMAVEYQAKNEPLTADSLPAAANNGVGKSAFVLKQPEVKDMDTLNFPAAVVEIVPGGQTLGTWLVSPMLRPQAFTVGSQEWHVAFRGERIYHPFAIKLLKATHEIYRGTDIPKNFQSRVRIENAATFENREVDIYMNNPLRYAGLTFYQYQMDKSEAAASPGSSTLQVVRNPSWLTPYLGCLIVALGMIWQFSYHLVGFIAKRTATAAAL
jgi:hypothetical protein